MAKKKNNKSKKSKKKNNKNQQQNNLITPIEKETPRYLPRETCAV